LGDVADDPVAAPTQTVGLFIDASSTKIQYAASGFYGSSAPMTDKGTSTNVACQ
jgi:hypothetical protein